MLVLLSEFKQKLIIMINLIANVTCYKVNNVLCFNFVNFLF